jgi:peptidoglycan/LPS O-acetylase OafA/YrhL
MDDQRDPRQFFPSSAPHRLGYRPDIDGLRAVAVGLVVLYHAWPKWLRSGFIGVDVFFVISGFLITSIILQDLERQTFSIREFYIRRIKRIFPALVTVVLATLFFGWYVLLQNEFAQLGKHIVAAATFLSNLVLWNEAGYFDNDAVTKPLLHLWSLGVEEQFYLVWPLMLAMFFRLRVGILLFLAATLAASFAYGLYATYSVPVEAYFSPVTRFWELASGGLVAYLLSRPKTFIPARQFLSVLGIVLLILGVIFIDGQRDFPGAWAALPVGGTCALIVAGNDCWINQRLLGNRLMAKLGLVSYPFYLWHWPLLSFGYIVLGEKPPAETKAELVIAALVLAFLTYHFIERPIQKTPHRARAIKGLVVSMACFGLLGVLVHDGLIRERIPTNGTDRYLRALNDLGFPQPQMRPLRYKSSRFEQLAGHGAGTTVLIGDSVMEQYAPLVVEGLSTSRFDRKSVIFATAGGCLPIRGAIRLPQIRFPKCAQTVNDAYEFAASPDVDTVVIAAAWYGYFSPAQEEVKMPVNGMLEQFPSKIAHEAAYASLQQSIQYLRDKGKRVYLILQPPTGDLFDPRMMITGSRFGEMKPRTDMEPFLVDTFRQNNAQPRARLSDIARQTGALVVDPVDYICTKGVCPVLNAAGEPIYTDPVHMRPYFVRSFVRYLDGALSSPLRQAAGPTPKQMSLR